MSTQRSLVGDLGIIALPSARSLGEKVDRHLVAMRAARPGAEAPPDTYLIKYNAPRFANGEGKLVLDESVRGKDLFILADVGNYGCTYKLFGMETRMGPDEHFQDIKRAISAISGNARRISVVMPLLYAGRQHKRKGRESLDCALALQELERLGVQNVITYDAHDPRVQHAIPSIGFENFYPTAEIIETLMRIEPELQPDSSRMIIISPDTGAMDRAVYYANVLGLDVGVFYKRRDLSRVVDGKNPIVQHEYIGGDLRGRDVLVVDDMVASGDSMIDLAVQLKERGARNIYVAVTFALFTEGTERILKCFAQGLIKRFLFTNLTYVPDAVRESEHFVEVDMSLNLATLIDRLNYDESISFMFDATERLRNFLRQRRAP